MTQDLAALQRTIDETRSQYFALRDQLQAQTKPFGAPLDFAERFAAVAEEFGVEEALNKLFSNPQTFDTGLIPPEAKLTVETCAYAFKQASDYLDELTVVREDLLTEADPSHERVYNLHGREFVMDYAAKKLHYLDSPAMTYGLTVTEHAPKRERKLLRPRDQGRTR